MTCEALNRLLEGLLGFKEVLKGWRGNMWWGKGIGGGVREGDWWGG